jgi:hypothetical protein
VVARCLCAAARLWLRQWDATAPHSVPTVFHVTGAAVLHKSAYQAHIRMHFKPGALQARTPLKSYCQTAAQEGLTVAGAELVIQGDVSQPLVRQVCQTHDSDRSAPCLLFFGIETAAAFDNSHWLVSQ